MSAEEAVVVTAGALERARATYAAATVPTTWQGMAAVAAHARYEAATRRLATETADAEVLLGRVGAELAAARGLA